MKEPRNPLLRLLSSASAVLFDFDGVLADSEEFYYLSYCRGFARYGHRIDREEYRLHWTLRGEGIEGECRRHGLRLSEAQKGDILKVRDRTYARFCRDGSIRLIRPSFEALRLLAAGRIPVVIASNSLPRDIAAIFRAHGVLPPVPVVARLPGLRPKPHPDIFLYAAGFLSAEPSRCLVVEDALKGLEAASTCGMACVIIRTPDNARVRFPSAAWVAPSASAFRDAVKDALGRLPGL